MFRTCSPVDLSICPSGLTGPEVNRGVKGIMVDSSTGGEVRNTHNAFFPLTYFYLPKFTHNALRSAILSWLLTYLIYVDLSTCLPGLTGLVVDKTLYCF